MTLNLFVPSISSTHARLNPPLLCPSLSVWMTLERRWAWHSGTRLLLSSPRSASQAISSFYQVSHPANPLRPVVVVSPSYTRQVDEDLDPCSPYLHFQSLFHLLALSLSTFRDRLQGNTTPATRAQICYRLRPLEASEAVYCPDLRLDFDPTTRRVRELVRWARELFEYDDRRRSTWRSPLLALLLFLTVGWIRLWNRSHSISLGLLVILVAEQSHHTYRFRLGFLSFSWQNITSVSPVCWWLTDSLYLLDDVQKGTVCISVQSISPDEMLINRSRIECVKMSWWGGVSAKPLTGLTIQSIIERSTSSSDLMRRWPMMRYSTVDLGATGYRSYSISTGLCTLDIRIFKLTIFTLTSIGHQSLKSLAHSTWRWWSWGSERHQHTHTHTVPSMKQLSSSRELIGW